MRTRLNKRLTNHRNLWLYKEWEHSKAEYSMVEIAQSRNMSVQQVSNILKQVKRDKWLMEK